jgi:hypothetical protein
LYSLKEIYKSELDFFIDLDNSIIELFNFTLDIRSGKNRARLFSTLRRHPGQICEKLINLGCAFIGRHLGFLEHAEIQRDLWYRLQKTNTKAGLTGAIDDQRWWQTIR